MLRTLQRHVPPSPRLPPPTTCHLLWGKRLSLMMTHIPTFVLNALERIWVDVQPMFTLMVGWGVLWDLQFLSLDVGSSRNFLIACALSPLMYFSAVWEASPWPLPLLQAFSSSHPSLVGPYCCPQVVTTSVWWTTWVCTSFWWRNC